VEGWKSVNTDPANYSAHRFLADSYAALPRHEIARVSELLRSQLLQPINITPVQPQLAVSNLFIQEGAGPADPSFNEFNPLFLRNRLALQASGVAGGKNTIGDEITQSGVWGRYSYSIGQFHYETDGFRENNDQDQDIYNAFVQMALSYKTSVQAEYQHKDVDRGDLPLRFTDEFVPTLRKPERLRSARLGFHHAFDPQSHLIGFLRYGKMESASKRPPLGEYSSDDEGYDGEIQHLFRSGRFNITSGAGHYDTDRKRELNITGRPIDTFKSDIRHTNAYVYAQINYPKNLTWTLGGSADFFKGDFSNSDQFNPKGIRIVQSDRDPLGCTGPLNLNASLYGYNLAYPIIIHFCSRYSRKQIFREHGYEYRENKDRGLNPFHDFLPYHLIRLFSSFISCSEKLVRSTSPLADFLYTSYTILHNRPKVHLCHTF
jgi:hypothetical protein